ncbi:transposase family protein [Actinomadura montaniterrae]|uniref:Transposase family protein n=1 Tax=Actinomadura montaniterrae TaxID=1803903 RepID=A0A6L3W3I5_9ACTN|nr:transposase family protein [Actinomadura montaniterrae]
MPVRLGCRVFVCGRRVSGRPGLALAELSVVEQRYRAVCLAFAAALREFGVPGEVLTDNGKQFTDRFGHGGEVLFDRICRDNGIVHRLTQPRSPTTTGKVERFHQSLRRELLDDAVPFDDLDAARAAVAGWGVEYNTRRPHQSLGMACPVDRFDTRTAQDEQELFAVAAARRGPSGRRPTRPRARIGRATLAGPSRSDHGRRHRGQGAAWRGGGVRADRAGQREHVRGRSPVLARPRSSGCDGDVLG